MKEISADWMKENLKYKELAQKVISLRTEQSQDFTQINKLVAEVNAASTRLTTWVYEETKKILASGKLFGLIGGDHSTPLGAIKAICEKHAVNGRSDVTAIRFGQEYTKRSETQSIALRSTFSLGLDALGATVIHSKVHNGDNDSRFLAWLGQAQYVRRIGQDTELVFRLDAQLADNPLPALEQFSLGGFDTVRGYRENRIVRDQGVIASVEWRIPIWHKANRPILDIAPFVDSGYAFNFRSDKDNPREWITSAGIGLLYNPNRRVSMQLYYGVPFKQFKNANDIQDQGVHFDLVLSAFE